ncbi:Ubiquitin-specific protease family C19-related protein [Rhynchospora pubera]|uniref:Ubiquitin-specific protease family C19-related protein n=1 Tax=Rhynchospora pubera TaxID=906938 RepID=A0AAV8H2Z8_9POAL|nr:Ubiquitin-specific protease family C19-related protein [Rhynchospora pubera]
MHQLGSGLYVSGPHPDQTPARERCLSSGGPVPYTGGDVANSGELGRMFDIPANSGPGIGGGLSSPRVSSRGSSRAPSDQFHRPSPSTHSGPLSQLQYSGLFVGPSPSRSPSVSSLGSARRVVKQPVPSVKESKFVFGIPFYFYFLVAVVLAAGVGVGIFLFAMFKRLELLIAAGGLVLLVVLLSVWNSFRKNKEAERYFRQLPDTAIDRENFPLGELVKITGQVTCGPLPLGASYHGVSRCVFTSIDLYESQGSNSSSSSRNLWHFKWELKHAARHLANFYISDKNTGTRYLVRAGESARVAPFVKSKTTEINKDEGQLSPDFLCWLEENNLSSNSQKLRIKEGFIKEGDTASVIGIVKQHHSYNIIDPPGCAITTGCQWKRCMFPLLVEGLVIIGHENSNELVYVV